MSVIENGYNHSPSEETARRKAERVWSNHEIAKRYREELAVNKEVLPKPEKAARVITPDDDDIETREQQAAKRLKTTRELRRQINFMKEIIRSGRSTITETTVAGYQESLRKRKRRLLLEKLRRLELAQQGG